MRRVAVLTAMALAGAAGVGAASLLTGATAVSQQPVARDELPAQTDELGARAEDPAGGPPWAVRILDRGGASRCIAAVRTEDGAAGTVDGSGHVRATPAVPAGSCADPSAEPLQVALAQFGQTSATGPRSVLLAIADASVAGVWVVGPDGPRPVTIDGSMTFIVVHDGRSPQDAWTVTVTLQDGSSRIYHL